MQPRPPEDLQAFWSAVPFGRLLGVSVEAIGDGTCELRLRVRPEHCNTDLRTVHGGVIASLIDTAVGGAVLGMTLSEKDKRGQTTIELNVSFMEAAQAEELFAKAWLLRRGRSVVFGEAEVRDSTGALFAKGRATYRIWRDSA